MGLVDFPAPVLTWIDAQLSTAISEAARIVFWAGVASVISMAIYWLTSPQRRLRRLVAKERLLKQQLNGEAADWNEGLASARHLLSLAFRRLALVLLPTLFAALPVISVMAWLHSHYAYGLPAPGDTVSVRAVPALAHGRVVTPANEPPRIEVRDNRDHILQSVPLLTAVPVVHKRLWWNTLIGNPLGYLRDDMPVDRVEVDLPEKRYLPVGPSWLRAWYTPFLATMLAASLLLRFVFRIR